MVLTLDPRFRLVWRTPTSLQFGLDSPAVVLHDVSEATDRMIAVLRRGISRSGVSMVCADAGGDEAEAESLLTQLAPVLLPESGAAAERSRRVALHGDGATADLIAEILRGGGVMADRGESTTEPDLAIIVAQFVIEPELHGLWLRRDVPHLAVVFGDASVRIGPVIEPGLTPCLHCLERQHTEADPAWPAIASQLWGQRSRVESPIVAHEVAAIVGRYALTRLRSGLPADAVLPRATSIRLDAATGEISRREWQPHPECACLALPGNGLADVRRATNRSRPTAPRRDAVAAVPA
jgi:bacteriocin biosynthesis cyclodehydratase domain-containing protein